MKKKWLFLLLALFVSSVFAPIGAQNAYAASVFDESFIIENLPVEIGDYNNTNNHAKEKGIIENTFDIGYILAHHETAIEGCDNSLRNNIIEGISDKPWFMTSSKQQGSAGGTYKVISIELNLNNSAITHTWDSYYLDYKVQGFESNATIRYNGSNWILGCNEQGESSSIYKSSVQPPYHEVRYIGHANYTIEYPENYEGIKPDGEVNTDGISPRIGWHVNEDNTINGINIGNNILVPVGLTEQTGMGEPRLKWEVIYNDEVLDEKITGLNVPYKYKVPQNGLYTLRVSYFDPPIPGLPLAPDVDFFPVEFEIMAVGNYMLGSTDLDNCEIVDGVNKCSRPNIMETCLDFSGTIPSVNVFDCVNGIKDYISILSFNAYKPNDGIIGVAQNNPNNCHELGKLGEWLNKEEEQICPAFSSDIRNTVTPFVTFALAGTVFFYISRGSGVVID